MAQFSSKLKKDHQDPMNGLDFTAISKVDVWVAGSYVEVTRFGTDFTAILRKIDIKNFKKKLRH